MVTLAERPTTYALSIASLLCEGGCKALVTGEAICKECSNKRGRDAGAFEDPREAWQLTAILNMEVKLLGATLS